MGGKNDDIVGVTDIHLGFVTHLSHKYLWRSEELLVQMGRIYFILWASLLVHLVLVLKKVLGRRGLSS